MSFNRLTWIVIAAVAMLGFTADTVIARTLDEIIKSGTIKVGVNPTLPPLGKFDEKNEIVDRWATWMEAEGYVVPSAWRDHMREGLAAIIAEERERAEVEAVEIRRCFE